jgi:hypothetical protein
VFSNGDLNISEERVVGANDMNAIPPPRIIYEGVNDGGFLTQFEVESL